MTKLPHEKVEAAIQTIRENCPQIDNLIEQILTMKKEKDHNGVVWEPRDAILISLSRYRQDLTGEYTTD